MTTLTLTDDNFDAFLDALYGGEDVFSIDLLAANPDIAAQVARGGFEVLVTRVEFEGVTVFVARGDDGGDGFDREEFLAWATLCETEAEARAEANAIIMQWKRNWDLA